MEYNLMGYRTLLDDPDLGQVTSTYNTFGELVSQTDSQGTTTYTYDKLGRVTREQRPDVTINSVYDTNYKGALTSSSASNGTSVTYQYDAYGRIHTQTDVIGTKIYTTQTSYNNLGKVNVITYPSGLTVKHEYASNGILNAVKNACRLRGLPLPTILAVTQDESTWHELAKAGFTHALTLPLDEEALLKSAGKTRAVVVAEEHNAAGGLGEAVAGLFARTIPTPVEFINGKDLFGQSGTPAVLMEAYGLDAAHIVEAAKKAIERK